MLSKSEIRKTTLANRKKLSHEEYEYLSKQLVESFIQQIAFKGNEIVSIFLPIKKQKEPNTFLLIEKLVELYPNLRFCVPVIIGNRMFQVKWSLERPLISNIWDIPEPIPPYEFVESMDINYVITPLLAFNDGLFRIGYGKGLYDKFFTNEGFRGCKVGYCLSSNPSDFEADDHDISLDVIITP